MLLLIGSRRPCRKTWLLFLLLVTTLLQLSLVAAKSSGGGGRSSGGGSSRSSGGGSSYRGGGAVAGTALGARHSGWYGHRNCYNNNGNTTSSSNDYNNCGSTSERRGALVGLILASLLGLGLLFLLYRCFRTMRNEPNKGAPHKTDATYSSQTDDAVLVFPTTAPPENEPGIQADPYKPPIVDTNVPFAAALQHPVDNHAAFTADSTTAYPAESTTAYPVELSNAYNTTPFVAAVPQPMEHSVESPFTPVSGAYLVKYKYSWLQTRTMTLHLTFTAVGDGTGWHINGFGSDNHGHDFHITEGNVSNTGEAFWDQTTTDTMMRIRGRFDHTFAFEGEWNDDRGKSGQFIEFYLDVEGMASTNTR